MKRHQDAVGIQQGACNPVVIANSLCSAIAEVRDKGTDAIWQDEAVRLIIHQMAWLAHTHQFDSGLEYQRCMQVCETAAKSGGRL